VPRASYTFYKQVLDNALDDLGAFEKAYIDYNKALSQQENLSDKVRQAYDKTANIVASLQADISDLKGRLQDLEIQINAQKPVVEDAHTQLIKAYKAEEDAIKTAFGLSVPQMSVAFLLPKFISHMFAAYIYRLNALTMVAFSPSKGMLGLQAATLLYQGFDTVPTIDGATVTKEYLFSQLGQSQATIAAVSDNLGKDKVTGEYQLDEAFAKRLVVERDRMMAQLNEFSQEALGGVDDADTRADLESKFNTFIDAVVARNNLIVSYNVTLKMILSKVAQIAAYKQVQSDLAGKEIKSNDPDLAQITDYVEKIYQASRSRVMKLLDVLLRSLNFRMLVHSDVYDYAFPGFDPDSADGLDAVPLSLTSTVLRNVRGNVEDKFATLIEEWGSEPAKFPNNFDNDIGKRFFLTDSQRQTLLADHVVRKYASILGEKGWDDNVK
jgi:hypothetical protein